VKLGVINITNKRDNQLFTEADADIVSYISYTAAVAINNQLNELKLEESFVGTIKALAEAIEAKDPYTRGHSERVAEISEGIARELGLEKEEIRMIKFAGILHDIGKIGVPEAVLRKPHPLDAHEYSQVRQHPDIGENILKNIATFDQVRIAIRQHHERIDGTGYPDALKGDEISLGARIIAVADTYDAMNSDRPYRQQRSVDYIQQELNRVAGQELDSRCLAAFFRYLQKK
jgi:putative nucleotidyltransferase with HDIG domain